MCFTQAGVFDGPMSSFFRNVDTRWVWSYWMEVCLLY